MYLKNLKEAGNLDKVKNDQELSMSETVKVLEAIKEALNYENGVLQDVRLEECHILPNNGLRMSKYSLLLPPTQIFEHPFKHEHE